ncbi:COG1361 S-layer family protein [Halorarius halobius]|uniref:COG1361 S-layer family protein n=1 Tax=Halorarius halobius TaxID=2962671 RepID=UPI0020CECE5A|nr:hypothetical protein [Halorarius halobius]
MASDCQSDRVPSRAARLLAVGLVAAVALTTASVVVAQQEEGTVVGRPSLELSVPDNRVVAGNRVALDVYVANGGDLDVGGPPAFEQRVTTARNVRLRIDEARLDDALADAIDVRTGSIVVGSVPEGVAGPVTFSIDVNESLAAGEYEIPVELGYDYTALVEYDGTTADRFVDFTEQRTETVTLVVDERARFDVEAASAGVVAAGDSRRYAVTVTNVGNSTATDAAVTVRTGNSSLFFTNRSTLRTSHTAFIDRLAPGESRRIAFRIGARQGTPPGVNALAARIRYTDPNGIEETTDPFVVGVPVGAERTFALQNVSSTLRVGATGTVRGELVNTGGSTVTDGTLRVVSESPTVEPREVAIPVGSLDPGEVVPVSFRADVANGTDPGARRLSVQLEYRDDEGDAHRSDRLATRVRVAPEQSFAVRNLTGSLQAGERGVVSGRLVNTGPGRVDDAVVVLDESGDALRPVETTAAVGSLEPGESTEFSFRVDAGAAADPGARPLSVRVRYRDANDDRRRSAPIDGSVTVAREQSFAVRNVTDTLRADGTGLVRGRLVNTGPASVDNAVVVLGDANGTATLRPRETEVAVGSLAPGETAPFSFRIDADNRTDSGDRQLSVRVRYRGRGDERRTSDPLDLRVSVAPERTFGVRNVSGSLRVGEMGTVRGVVVNTGDVAVGNASVVVASGSPALDPRVREVAVGRLPPGEATSFAVGVDVANRTDAGPRRLSFRVRYRDRTGAVRTGDTLDTRVTVAPEPTFALRDVTDTLRVGETGTVRGVVVNTGPAAVEGVVVVLRSTGPTLDPRATEYAVGRLAPGETSPFAFSIDVSNRTSAGPRPISARVRYRGRSESRRLSDPLDARVSVARAADEFRIEPLAARVEVDGRTVLVLRVRNLRNETFADVRARLGVSEPLETDDATSFVPRLGVNQSVRIRFDLSTTNDAIPKTDSVAVTFSYTDESGTRQRSDPYFVAVSVVRPESPFPLVPAAAVAIAVALAAVWWWRRRR